MPFDVFLELINVCNQYGETGDLGAGACLSCVALWTSTCKTKITVSLNILFYGFQPERPLTCHIKDAGDAPINPRFCPQLSDKPVAVVDGRLLFCMLGEIKADWKIHKDQFC